MNGYCRTFLSWSNTRFHSFPSPGTFVVKRFERNSRIKFVPNLPARPRSIEKGRFHPNLRLAFKIARAFGKQIGDVFIYEDTRPLDFVS
jgi:hypothetical protein